MKLTIHRTLPEEANILSEIAFSAKAHWGYPNHWMEMWKPQFTFSAEYFIEHESWTAELDDKPIAFYTLEEKDGSAWIENLWVLPEHMGKGIGKHLFLDALSRSRSKGYRTLRLEADPNAAGFYEKMGMHQVGESSRPIDEDPSRVLPLMRIRL